MDDTAAETADNVFVHECLTYSTEEHVDCVRDILLSK